MAFYIDTDELVQIAVSVLAIALAVTLTWGGLGVSSDYFVFLMIIATLTIGIGFVCHELAHKFVAMHYGARARFVAWPIGLVIMLALVIVPQLFGFPGFLFAAPGAVYIFAQRLTVKENGIISVAGPATNILIGFAFFGLLLLSPAESVPAFVASIGMYINFFLAFFNLLPIPPLDGSKVIGWSLGIWFFLFFLAFILSGFGPFG